MQSNQNKNNPTDAINSVANKALKEMLIDSQKRFAANCGIALMTIKDAHDESFNQILGILQQFDTNAAKILHENEMLKAENETLKKLLQEVRGTSAIVEKPQTN